MAKTKPVANGKKLPVAYYGEEGMSICLELLSLVYGESEIIPVPLELETEGDGEDYLTRKYKTQMEGLFLAIDEEIIFPLVGMFDCDMFILNYHLFYTQD